MSLGGLGIPRAQDIAWSAFTGSVVDTMELQKMILKEEDRSVEMVERVMNGWNTAHKGVGTISVEQFVGAEKTQRDLTYRVHEYNLERLKKNEEASFRATVLGCTMNGSGAWLKVVPDRHRNLTMDPQSYARALQFRLGMDLYEEETKCGFCAKMMDRRGQHAGICTGVHYALHNAVRNELCSEGRRAGRQPELEKAGILDGARQNERPADVFFPLYRGSRGLCVDVTIINSYGDLTHSAESVGVNAQKAAEAKRLNYEKAVVEAGWKFSPFPMETLGGFGEECDEILRSIGEGLARFSGISTSKATKRLQERISFRYQKFLGIILSTNLGDT